MTLVVIGGQGTVGPTAAPEAAEPAIRSTIHRAGCPRCGHSVLGTLVERETAGMLHGRLGRGWAAKARRFTQGGR